MLLEIEIPEQKEDTWFEIESKCWIVAQVVSTRKSGIVIQFMLDCRIPNPTIDDSIFKEVILTVFRAEDESNKKYILSFTTTKEDSADLKVSSVRVVDNFSTP